MQIACAVAGSVPKFSAFDAIGNRESSSERGTNCTYVANDLNQYTSISNSASSAPSAGEIFLPQFDDDGNQILIKTAMGIWQVQYNGENRPILWECVTSDSNTPNSSTPSLLSMSFDRMGRRVIKNAQRFVYDGYLQIANFESSVTNSQLTTYNSQLSIWDPTEPVATRPLVRNCGASAACYTHDGNKNVSEVVAENGDIAAHYEYAPFGAVVAQHGASAATNPWRFSSEYAEDDTATVYYNYRHYEPVAGRWLRRDPVGIFVTLGGLYSYCQNRDYINDIRGLYYYLKGCDPYGYTSNVVIITPNCIEDKDSKCWILQAGSYSPRITVEDYGYYSLTNEAGRCFLAKCRRFDEDKKLTMQHEQEHVRIVQEAIDKANEILGLPKTFQSKTICEAYYKVRSEEWETPVVKAKRDQKTHTGNSPTPTPITFYKEYDANRCEIKEVDCDK